MGENEGDYHGHMTMADGSHVALSAEDAKALWEASKRAQAKAEADFPDEQTALRQVFLSRLAAIDIQEFTDKRVIVKGCGDLAVGGDAYMEIARRLRPVAKSIMYGEACSNVPVYKKK